LSSRLLKKSVSAALEARLVAEVDADFVRQRSV
jgi:hypothetical protein